MNGNSKIVIDALHRVPPAYLDLYLGTFDPDDLNEIVKGADKTSINEFVDKIKEIGLNQGSGLVWLTKLPDENNFEESSLIQKAAVDAHNALKAFATEINECKFISKIKSEISKDTDAVKKLRKIVEIDLARSGDFSIFSKTIIVELMELCIPGFNEFINKFHSKDEKQKACDGYIQLFKQIISDKESDKSYYIDFVSEYVYRNSNESENDEKVIHFNILSDSYKEAFNMHEEASNIVGYYYPYEPDYTRAVHMLKFTVTDNEENILIPEKVMYLNDFNSMLEGENNSSKQSLFITSHL